MKLELLSKKVVGGEDRSPLSTEQVGLKPKGKSVSPPPLSGFSRRSRSKSSPTRTQTDNRKILQYYSPTISCSTVAANGEPNANFSKLDDSNENLEQRIYSFGPTEAYFSTKPPISPLKIVMVGEPNQDLSIEDRAQRLLENIRKMEDDLEVTTLRREFITVEESLNSYSFKSTTDRSRGRLRKFDTSLRAKRFNDVRVFRLWLNELISNLPISMPESVTDLSETGSTSNRREKFRLQETPISPVQSLLRSSNKRCGDCRKGSANSSQRRGIQLTSGQSCSSLIAGNVSSPIRSPVHSPGSKCLSRCNIAVQALSRNFSKAEMSTTCSVPTVQIPDEWVGGVRALRDSHVRLVLKQLRHIDRLNRALDRAVRGTGNKRVQHKHSHRN